MSQSLAQKRARHALERVSRFEKPEEYGNYVAYVKALPATIITSGLGQALAMEKSGARSANESVRLGHKNLFEHLDDWLCRGWPSTPYNREGDVLAQIVEKGEADYIRAQAEALAYLEWLKKLAVAHLKAPDEDEDA